MNGSVAAARRAAIDPAITSALMQPAATVEVWAGCTYRLTLAETAVVTSPPFQRLRTLRQMGLAHHAWPNAENTRLSHSLGVGYWAAVYLAALHRVDDAETQMILRNVATELDGLSLDLIVRLYALLHDIDLLPLGHTLRYQSGLFAEAAGRPRLAACVADIRRHVRAHAFHDGPDGVPRAALTDAFEHHLNAAALALADPDGADLPVARLANDIVNSGIGADLVDFALRDSFALGRPQALHRDLPTALRLVRQDGAARLALEASAPGAADAVVSAADDLYRARFEVFDGAVFHPVKLAADAMLDFILRRIVGAGRGDALDDGLLALGDDAFLDRLWREEARVLAGSTARPLGEALATGRLHREIYRNDDLAAFRVRPDAERALALDPIWRGEIEAALAARLPWAEPGDVIVAIASPRMQAKPADARFVGPGGARFILAEAAARGYPTTAAATAARYGGLWSLRVYLAPERQGFARQAADAARSLFGAAAPS